MMILACVNKATFIYLQSLGKALLSMLLSMIREVVLDVGFALLLPLFFGLDGVLYSMPVSDFLTFLISTAAIIYTYRTLREMTKEKTKKAKSGAHAINNRNAQKTAYKKTGISAL